jgi:hypothetical protein
VAVAEQVLSPPRFTDEGAQGRALVGSARQRDCRQGTLWLLCHPDLEGLYQRMGFTQDTVLPQSLSERLVRYKRNKPMIAMGLDRLVRSSSDNV